jgi:hypothetical protein
MKLIEKPVPHIYEPVHTQREYSVLTGLDPVTANNFIARKIVQVAEVVPGRGRGTRLFTPLSAWEGRILNEAVKHHKMPLGDAAKIAEAATRLATKGGYVDHWARALSEGRPFVPAFMVVTWPNDSYDAQITNRDKGGGPDFSRPKMARFLAHPFMVVPLSALFEDVWEKSMAMLSADQKA